MLPLVSSLGPVAGRKRKKKNRKKKQKKKTGLVSSLTSDFLSDKPWSWARANVSPDIGM